MRPARMATLLLLLLAAGPAAAAPQVAVDIAPLHAIVARVMAGAGAPELLLPPGASPHAHALRPSEASRLQAADVVVWVGEDLTPWLADPIEALAPEAFLVTVAEAPGVRLLPVRAEGPEGHGHEHGHAEEHTGMHDPHLWLDPANAAAAARAVAAALAEADPANADAYGANTEAFEAEAAALSAEIERRLAPVRGRRYLVFHDAYQYFEAAFDFPAAGAVALHEGSAPGAASIAELRGRVAAEEVVCAFAEPQFEPELLGTVLEGTEVRTGVLDPLGAGLEPGPELYPELMRGLSASFADCLGG